MERASARPRVLILNSCVNGGGAGRSLVAYLEHEAESIDPIVVMPEAGVIAEQLNHGEQIIYVPEFVERVQRSSYPFFNRLGIRWLNTVAGGIGLLVAMRKIRRLAARLKPDVIYCNHMLAKPVGAYVGSQLGIPVVFHARNIHVHWLGRACYQWLGRLKSTKLVICNSNASAEPYAVYSAEKIRVVSNFIDLRNFNRSDIVPRLHDEFQIPKNALVIGYLGRILKKKGIDVLIRSFAKVHSRVPNSYLVLVGDNDGGLHRNMRAEYEELARSLGVGGQTIFTGFQPDIRPYVADFDILSLPSVEPESFGRVLIEAMSLGIPAVISAHGGAKEVVSNGVNGLWATPGNVEELASALEQLLVNPELRQRLGNQGAIDVRRRYDGTTLSRQITSHLYEAARRSMIPSVTVLRSRAAGG